MGARAIHADIVILTVYITDSRQGDELARIRRELDDEGTPASTLMADFVRPVPIVEI